MEKSFSDLGISPKLLTILDKLQFKVPTPIQEQSIPVAMEGKDVIGIAQTGTGKTLAFSLPMLQRIAADNKQGLIVLPTRELAFQVDEELQKIGTSFGLRTALLVGGAPMQKQLRQINANPHVIIGTPGRINDHLEERRTLNLSRVGVLVLDEADRMLDMGFAPQIRRIMKHVPKQRQTMLFSATMPNEIRRLVNEYMKDPVAVEVAQAGTVADRVSQSLHILEKHQKNQLLEKLLTEYNGTVLVFSRTKHGAKKICRSIKSMGHEAAELHSNLTLPQRRRSMEGFKSGKFRVLVATDIAARGIDVTNIELVINYDLPDNSEDYVHRVGRTGRAGKMGRAISFATPDQKREVNDIEASVQQRIAVLPLPELPPARQSAGHDSYRTEQSTSGNRRRTKFSYARPPRGRQPRRSSNNRQRSSAAGHKARVHV